LFLLIPFVTKTFSQPPDPSQIPEPQIAYALHATWDPDLTDNNPSVCTTSGTVAVPWFHFYAGWKDGAPAFFSVDWVLIEELTTEHEPQVWYFENPQGESGFPYGCTMPPVSDPQNWNWTTWSFAPMIGFAMHNTSYRITVQWRYGVYMKGPRGPFQTSITINVQNLVVTSPDVGKVLRWDPEKGIADTSFSYNIECAQKKQVSVRVRIYDMNRNLVYELTEQKICPGSYSFIWDGTVNTGYYEYPPDEWSNIAPAGLYTFDMEVIANPYDRDAVRSQALTVVPGPVEYLGYDDGGTPEDESDDNHLYYLRWYALYSGRDASYGEIWLYDPDLERVQSWIVPVLQCVVHENCDGLTANPNGEIHGIIISVPVSSMEKAGTYLFVLHFYDDYADSYRNHQVKVTLEVNAIICVPKADNYVDTDGYNYYKYFHAATVDHQKKLPDGSAYRAKAWADADSSKAMSRVKEATIIYIYGHGQDGGGYISFNGGGWYAKWRKGVKKEHAINQNDFSTVKFIAFVGCETSLTHSDDGNLLDEVIKQGATTALGFRGRLEYNTDDISNDPGIIWTNEFWKAALGKIGNPKTIKEAAQHATRVVLERLKSHKGYNTWEIKGEENLRLAPAKCKRCK
jgi:hypothetical protein